MTEASSFKAVLCAIALVGSGVAVAPAASRWT